MKYFELLGDKKNYLFTRVVFYLPGFLWLLNLWVPALIVAGYVVWAFNNSRMFIELRKIVDISATRYKIYHAFCLCSGLAIYYFPETRVYLGLTYMALLLYLSRDGFLIDEYINNKHDI
jgi:hypothetical protein